VEASCSPDPNALAARRLHQGAEISFALSAVALTRVLRAPSPIVPPQLQVTASAAQKRRVVSAKRNDDNVKRRGLVDDPAAEVSSAILTHHTPQSKQDHHQPGLTRSTLPLLLCAQRRAGKLSVGPILLGFFLFVIVGSCT
jgi:hypothetical protein